jgi:2,4-dienoyl-CoA reductase-like NADH-dependent reductase (Old Yellow Enzyme family)
MSKLFEPLKIRDVVLRNRIAVSPMCQYSSIDGMATDWHTVHLGSRAVGGAGLVICEATAVQDIGRISPGDAGLWKDEQIDPLQRINQFIHSQGSVAGIQLAHAGRKASTCRPWERSARLSSGASDTILPAEGGWGVVSPSALAFSETYPMPRELSKPEIKKLVGDFKAAAQRALKAGYKWVEIHAAHGYLAHSFLSPLSNQRTDEYGGDFENRIRFLMEVTAAIRETWPERWPLAVRISASDWVDGGWSLEQSVELSRRLRKAGVDLIDCSSGGLVPHAKIPVGPGYQVHFSQAIRQQAEILTGAVGLITEAHQAEDILKSGKADVVLLARELLRDPYWPLHAAQKLGAKISIPNQYERAFHG